MHAFLAFHTTYDSIECALYALTNTGALTLVDGTQPIAIEKALASSQLLSTISGHLLASTLSLSDIAFIAVNRGPAPFTTLRIAIATANGISFARNIPLVGVDALLTLANTIGITNPLTVVLLNAFNREVYYAIPSAFAQSFQDIHSITDNTINQMFTTGCITLTTCIEKLKQLPAQPIRFVGNGARMYTQELYDAFGSQTFIDDSSPSYCSLEDMASEALMLYNTQPSMLTHQISPLYLKNIR